MARKPGCLAASLLVVGVLMSSLTASSAGALSFVSGSYPQTVTGEGKNIGEHFQTEAGSVACERSTAHGTLKEASPTLTLKRGFENCTAFGFLGATVSTAGCNDVLHLFAHHSATGTYTARVSTECESGKSIVITASTCKFEIKAQGPVPDVDITNMTAVSPDDITVKATVGELAYTVTQDGFGCPFNGTGSKTGGEYTSSGYMTVTAAGGLTAATTP